MRVLFLLFFGLHSVIGISQQSDDLIIKILADRNLDASNASWRITSEHTSSTSKIHHVYYQQSINGILIRGTESSVHLSSTNELLYESNRFVNDISEIKKANKSEQITSINALESVVAQMGYIPTSNFSVKTSENSVLNSQVFSDGGVSQRDIPAYLVYVLGDDDTYRLVWEVSILELDYGHWWDIQLNSVTGEIMNMTDRIERCNFDSKAFNWPNGDYNANLQNKSTVLLTREASNGCSECYEVLASPLANPFGGDRIIIEAPADPLASPFGWHDTDGKTGAESFFTEGNNVKVTERGDNIGYQPDGGEFLNFTGYPFSPDYTLENQFEDAALTNVFYWNNLIHDVFYHYGFDEQSGNFQKINYYVDGVENDDMDARVQARIGCAAWAATGSNGVRPIMILGLCDDRDSAFDNIVIVHEYGHAMVNRLIGGSGDERCLGNDEQMIEGWADYFGLFLTQSSSDMATDRRPIANFFFGQGPNGKGIRKYPYSTDFSEDPQTYDSIKSERIPHGVGSVWATMLWEMTWALIDAYGFDENLDSFTGDINQDAGNIMAMAIVIEGLKLMRCQPGFVDAREAILLANREIYGWENDCVIYGAFAKRGLGLLADQGLGTSRDDGTEDFTNYPTTSQISETPPICSQEAVITGLSGGLPPGGVYSGQGIIDDGNGVSFSIDTSISGIGDVVLTYEINDSFCAVASSAETILKVDIDNTPPTIECPVDREETVALNRGFVLPNYLTPDVTFDNCSESLTLIQDPVEFTELPVGEHLIRLKAIDEAGNSSECQFLLSVFELDPDASFSDSVFLYPVPSVYEVFVFNPSGRLIQTVIIQDVNGRSIKEINVKTKDKNISIPVNELSPGYYFLNIQGEGETIVKGMIKM